MALLPQLLAAYEMTKDSPIEVLPLELLASQWGKDTVTPGKVSEDIESTVVAKAIQSDNLEMTSEMVVEVWPQVLLATKAHNHTLVAVLRSARPMGIDQSFLVIEVDYPFHKQKLEEQKNRDIVEKVVSDIMGKEVKIKFVLGGKKNV